MALIKCPECGKEISDKSEICIGCGFPIKEYLRKIEDIEIEEEKKKEQTEKEQEKIKEKYWCRSCYKQNEIGKDYCVYCGNRLTPYFDNQDNLKEKSETEEEFLDRIYKSENGKRVKMIKAIREEKGYDLEISKRMVDEYWQKNFPSKELCYTKQEMCIKSQNCEEEKRTFNGIYKYTFFGGKQEVYCPRCGSENCSHYQEQKIIPGKTKTRYTANLNPLKPFTLVNKKEKVVRKDEIITESKFLCNSCGMIFK